MDSLTHIVLGAAIGDRILGKKIGRKAAWIGALAKTFPDFDLLYSGLNDPRKYILYHRSYTHSFFVELLTAFPLAWLCYFLFNKFKKEDNEKISYAKWFTLWIVCLWAHSLVDIFTNYGTRIFLPFSTQLVSLNNIAIADLFLTIPILFIVIVALFYKNESKNRIRLMRFSLLYAVLYFGMTFVNKAIATSHFKQSLQEKNIVAENEMNNPTILNNFLWYSLANKNDTLYVGEYSLFQQSNNINWLKFPIQKELLHQNPSADARMLEWFSQGYFICNQNKDTLEVFCPKFGRGNLDELEAKKTFLFYYKIFKQNGEWKFASHEPNKQEIKFKEGILQLIRWIKK